MNKKILFFLSLFLIIIGLTSLVYAFECGDIICDGAKNWHDREDASTCYKDCHNKEFVSCEIDKAEGGSCNFRGKIYKINAEVASDSYSSCGPAQMLDVDVNVDSHAINTLLEPNKWRFLHDDIMITYDTDPCMTYKLKYNFHLTGLCKTEDCKIKADLILNQTNFYKSEGKVVFTVNVNLSHDLEAPYCEFFIVDQNDDEEKIGGSAGCGWPGDKDYSHLDPGIYKYKVIVSDKEAQNKICEATTEFKIHECKDDLDCDDNNPCTIDACSGDLKTCSHSKARNCFWRKIAFFFKNIFT